MARKIVYLDDINGDEGAETVSFTVGGEAYEIDLGERMRKQFDEALAVFIEHARRAEVVTAPQQRQRPGPKSGRMSPQRTDREQAQAVRDWARANGVEVAERGRIPFDVLNRYEQAHGGKARTVPNSDDTTELRRLRDQANALLKGEPPAAPPALFSAPEKPADPEPELGQDHSREECPDLDNCPKHSGEKPAETKPEVIEVTSAGVAEWMQAQGMDPAGVKFLKRLSLFKQGHPGAEVKYIKDAS